MYTDTGETTHEATARGSAAIVAIGPLVLLGALLWHPPLPGRLPDSNAVADAAAADTTMWGLSHLALTIASAMIVLSFVAVRGHLRDCGDRSLSAVGLGFVVIGSTLYAVLPGMEFSLLAADETGADLAATQDALESWFVPVLIGGSLLFAIGTTLFAVAVVRSATLGRTEALVIAGALVFFGLSRLVPIGVVQFYVQPAAALLALLPIAAEIAARTARPARAGAA
ncbi:MULTISPECIES: hypothetical protein [Nocardioides]|uniref:DUF4386 family protein n=1 Tax=Nocardioides vastitatis TaxID=2568655 RepID=A0ABW0ZFP9_9ACTN|nr:hypothetical protein [Nocardioides sp.]THI95723.1 hypothetical protein E7Z54_18275 [Nocardioides sp.]